MQLLEVLLCSLMRLAGLVLPATSFPMLSCFMVDPSCEGLSACSRMQEIKVAGTGAAGIWLAALRQACGAPEAKPWWSFLQNLHKQLPAW